MLYGIWYSDTIPRNRFPLDSRQCWVPRQVIWNHNLVKFNNSHSPRERTVAQVVAFCKEKSFWSLQEYPLANWKHRNNENKYNETFLGSPLTYWYLSSNMATKPECKHMHNIMFSMILRLGFWNFFIMPRTLIVFFAALSTFRSYDTKTPVSASVLLLSTSFIKYPNLLFRDPTCKTLHFFVLNFIFYLSLHWHNLSRSSCSFRLSLQSRILLHIFVSPANCIIRLSFPSSISSIYIWKLSRSTYWS